MSVPHKDSIPVVIRMTGIEKLNLQPTEAFVFSRVNGTSSLKEIAQILSYDVERVWSDLSRLLDNGFIRLDEPKGANKKESSSIGGPKSILQQLDEEERDRELSKIPRERRNEILLRHSALEMQDHYEMLGVNDRASTDDIKKAYFRMAKEFHPDRFFGQELGHYKAKLEAIFARATKAMEELTNETRRKAYDVARRAKEEGREAPTSDRKGKGSLLDRLANARRYFDMGRREEDAGNSLSAANFYQLASQFDPHNREYDRAWSRLKPAVNRARAEESYRRGAEARDRGDTAMAAAMFEEVLELNPRKKECYRDLAMLYVVSRSNLERAKELALQAAVFFADDSNVHAILGQVYRELGDMKLAAKEFKVALKLDGENDYAREALDELGKK